MAWFKKIEDGFARVGSSIGGNWTEIDGTNGFATDTVPDGVLYIDGTASVGYGARHETHLGSANQYAATEVANVEGFAGATALRARWDGEGVATEDCYHCYWQHDTGYLALARIVDGVYTRLGSQVLEDTYADHKILRQESEGTTQRAFVDGVEKASRTDSTIASGDHTGIWGITDDVTNNKYTSHNFEAGDDVAPLGGGYYYQMQQ